MSLPGLRSYITQPNAAFGKRSKMKLFLFLSTLLFSLSLPVSAQDDLLTRDLEKTFKRYELLRLSTDSLQQTVSSGEKIKISAYGRAFEFDLELHDLRAPNYRAVETNTNGSYEMPRGDIKTYRGKLTGDPNSQVRFTIDSQIFEGLIYTDNIKYFVTRARQFSKHARADDVVVYSDSDISDSIDLTEDISGRVEDQLQLFLQQPGMDLLALAELRQLEVATEADFQWVSQAGGAAAANNEILSVMNVIDGIYRRDLNLTVVVTFQHAWSSSDPFTASSMQTLLDSFLNYWNVNYPVTQVSRDTTHLFTGKFSSQGLAYVGVICRSPGWAYGVTARSGPSNHLVAAHEIGHNLGADHVANSGSCATSMMNPYISSSVTGFCGTSISVIGSFVSSNGSCLAVVGQTPTPTPSPSPTPTIAPSPSPTPTVAPSPSPTPTVAPSPTPTTTPPPPPAVPTPTPTPVPSPTPTPAPTPDPNVRTNFASPLYGAVATSSSGPVLGAVDGSRTWVNGGAWKDADPFVYPDWLQLDFGGARIVDEINIYGVRDDYMSPVEPTTSTVSTVYGLHNFNVQYWNGSTWANVPGGSVSGNNLVLRKLSFSPITTSRIRVVVNSAMDGFSRIVELEAWGGGNPNSQPSPTPTVAPSPTPTVAPSPTPTIAPNPSPTPTPVPSPTPSSRVNVALAANGATASASSALAEPRFAIDGTRIWALSGSWKDSTPLVYPDWIQVDFNGSKTIEEINLFGVRDDYLNVAEPVATTVSTVYGLVNFSVQYWNGSSWVNVPGGSVTANNLVWRKFTFSPITTSRIRVVVNSAVDGFSRVVELEAWGGGTSSPQPSPTPTVAPSPTPTIAPSPSPTPTPVPSPTPGIRMNVALSSNGAAASASSALTDPRIAIDGMRSWALSGSWKDSTHLVYPDWLQVDFNGSKTIDEINLYGVRDDYFDSGEPGASMVSTVYALVNFDVQYWNGATWADVPGGKVAGNNSVVRKLKFSPITTSRIRVVVNSAADGFSRIVELEAWTASSSSSIPPAQSDRVNFALSSKGSVANASSQSGAGAAATDGSQVWAAGGAWKDDSPNVYPDWLQVDFNAVRTIDEINVYGVMDDFQSMISPTTSTTASLYGLTAFDVQYWNGESWTAVPNGSLKGNDKVVNRFTFAPISTTSIRVVIQGAQDGSSRIVELEAWGVGSVSGVYEEKSGKSVTSQDVRRLRAAPWRSVRSGYFWM